MSNADFVEIAIVGGGIAGLSLALNLHKRGLSARVFEVAPEIKPIGVGITLLPHAMAELAGIGLDRELGGIAIENETSAFFNRFGQQIYQEPRGKFAGYPHPELGIHRGHLHMTLHQAARTRLGAEAIVTDRRCVGLDQDESGVTLHFRATSPDIAVLPVRAGIVVACDGIGSTVRSQFYPDEKLAFTGINTWRGVTRRKPILGGRTYMRIGSIRTGKMVIYPIVDDIDGTGLQLINWVAEVQSPPGEKNDWNMPGRLDDLLPLYESWTFDWLDVADLIRTADTVLEYPMVDKDPVEHWTFGRVTLAGDAAHPMYPRGSNGSAQALIDGRVLADLLAGTQDRQGALTAYEAARLPVTAAIVRTNREHPPDFINIKVEELVGDRPFTDLDAVISQAELREISDSYKRIAGFAAQAAATR